MRKACLFTAVLCAFLGGASAQSPQLLNNFDSGTEGWFQNFGTINIVSASGGLLTWVSPGGTSGAISDSFNNTNALFQPNAGGVDLTGMSSLNFHLGYTGSDPTIDVQFFVQASPSSTYVALGPDQTVSAGAKNLIFSAPLSGLTPEQIAYIRTWGINIRSHSADANFSLGFVSSSGTPLFSRQFATFEPGTPDGEFNSAIVNFDGAGVQGNSGQNNSGLSVVGGSLQWLDLGGGPGGAISIFNGFNTGFNGRPTDLSNYDYIHWAISGDEGVVKTISPVNLQFFLQTTNGFTYSVLGPDQSFTPDGTLYSFYAPLGNVGNTDFVQTIGMNVAGHPQDITFSVDFIEAGQALPYSFNIPPSSSGTVSRLQLNGSNLELIQEPTGTPLFSIPAALVNPITITGVADQDDMLIIDYSNAAFGNISVNFLGGDGGNDSLEFIGAGYPAAEYHVSDGMNGSGGILLNGGTIVFTGLEPVTMSGIGVIDFETPANEDNILVDSPGAGQNRISGTSNGGIPFEALTFYDVTTFILDTGFNDVSAPNDVVVIDPAGLVASNLVDFQILTGEGDDIVNGQGAIATAATLTVNAGPGVDSVTGTFDADIILGGPGNDTLVGSRGNDQIFGEEDNDTLIWNNGDNTDLMEGGPGDDVVLVNGAPAAGDHFKMRPNGMRFDFDRINLIPFTLDIGTSETLDVNGLGGDDIFDVTASADLFIDLDGFGHVTGDTLNVDAQGQSVMVSKGVFPLPNGTIQVDSLQPIVYSNMEDVNILNQLAPTETETSVPTQTETPLPPTATETPVPPTATETLVPPTATSTETEIPTSTETEVPSPTPTNTFGPVVQAATLTISCSCTIGIYGGPDPFHIRIVGGTLPEADPPAVSCEVFNSLVDCQIDCSAETGFGCDVVLGNVTRQIINCINTQAAGVVVGVTVAGDPGVIGIQSTQPFYIGLCSQELNLDCNNEVCYPLSTRPLYNICDGDPFNQSDDDLTCGLGFEVENVVEGTPTPSATPATPTETPTEPPFMCVQAANVVFECAGEISPNAEPIILKIAQGVSTATQCAISRCDETPFVECFIDLAALADPDPLDQTPFDCDEALSSIVSQVLACISAQSGGSLVASTDGQPLGTIYVQGESSFHCCLCSNEIPGLNCAAAGFRWPLDNCPLYNLGDGVSGNEETDFSGFVNGIGVVCLDALCPAPTSTPTPTETVPTETPTVTESPTITPTPGCESGLYMLISTGEIERVGHPFLINGEFNFPIPDFAKDLERGLSNSGPPTTDLVVLDGSGIAHFVEHPADDVAPDVSAVFPPDMNFPTGRAVDLQMTTTGDGFWVLTDFGGIYRAGDARQGGDPVLVPGTDMIGLGADIPFGAMRRPGFPPDATLRAVAMIALDAAAPLDDPEGFIVMDSQGGHYQFGPDGGLVAPGTFSGSPVNSPERLLEPDPNQGGYVWPFFPGIDIARDAELFPTAKNGIVVFDGWGGIHPIPVNDPANPVFFTRNEDPMNPGTLITTVGMPYIVAGFDDPETLGQDESDPVQYGADVYSIFTDFEFSAGCEMGFYTLDKFGGVFVFGEARNAPDSIFPAWALPYIATQNAVAIELFGFTEAGP